MAVPLKNTDPELPTREQEKEQVVENEELHDEGKESSKKAAQLVLARFTAASLRGVTLQEIEATESKWRKRWGAHEKEHREWLAAQISRSIERLRNIAEARTLYEVCMVVGGEESDARDILEKKRQDELDEMERRMGEEGELADATTAAAKRAGQIRRLCEAEADTRKEIEREWKISSNVQHTTGEMALRMDRDQQAQREKDAADHSKWCGERTAVCASEEEERGQLIEAEWWRERCDMFFQLGAIELDIDEERGRIAVAKNEAASASEVLEPEHERIIAQWQKERTLPRKLTFVAQKTQQQEEEEENERGKTKKKKESIVLSLPQQTALITPAAPASTLTSYLRRIKEAAEAEEEQDENAESTSPSNNNKKDSVAGVEVDEETADEDHHGTENGTDGNEHTHYNEFLNRVATRARENNKCKKQQEQIQQEESEKRNPIAKLEAVDEPDARQAIEGEQRRQYHSLAISHRVEGVVLHTAVKDVVLDGTYEAEISARSQITEAECGDRQCIWQSFAKEMPLTTFQDEQSSTRTPSKPKQSGGRPTPRRYRQPQWLLDSSN